MTRDESELFDRLRSMPITEARLAVSRKEFGEPPDSQNYLLARGIIEAREAEMRDIRDEATISIAREALQSSRRANLIAISAAIFSGVATFLTIMSY